MVRSSEVSSDLSDSTDKAMNIHQAASKCAAILLTLALCVAPGLIADDVQSALEAKIAALIRQLGAEDFSEREGAANELFKIGERARPALKRAAKESADVEIRTRAGSVIKRLDRADLESAEVHAVGLHFATYSQYMIEAHGRRVNWSALCAQLVKQGGEDKPTPGKRIWDLLDDQARGIASNPDKVAAIVRWIDPPKDLDISVDVKAVKDCRRLCDALTAIATRDDFYDAKHFVGLDLHPEAKELLPKIAEVSQLERWVVHRRLLEASFPEAFKPSLFTLENATVPIHVKATARPIVLVLSSSGSVRWQIKAAEGAKLKRVIVGGYHPQLVVGTTAPVQMHVYDDPKNVDQFYFYAHQRDKENFPRLVDCVRDLTELDITSFQGVHSARQLDDGFVVGK